MRTVALRLGTYGLSTAFLGLASLASIPAVIAGGGKGAWVSYVLGQAIGSILAIVSSFGWTVGGPARAAQLHSDEISRSCRVSVFARLVVFGPFAVAAVVIYFLISNANEVETAVIALAIGVSGMSSSWLLVGTQRPGVLLALDTTPRVAGMLIGSVAISLTGSLMAFAVLVFVGNLCAVLGPFVYFKAHRSTQPISPRDIFAALRDNRSGAIATLASTVYLSLPVLYLGAFVPTAVVQFGLVDRLHKFISAGLQPLAQFNQGWVPGGNPLLLRKRILRVLKVNLALGLVIGGLVVVLAPAGALLLSVGRVQIGFEYSLPLGVVIFATVVSQCTGMTCLAALSRSSDIAISAMVGAVVGLPMLFLFVSAFSGAGAVWSVAATEVLVLLYQTIALSRALVREVDRGSLVRHETTASTPVGDA
jgi:hypothetical protein